MASVSLLGLWLKDYTETISTVGLVVAACFALKIVKEIWTFIQCYVLSPMLDWGADLKAMGEWAVVTGATDGIGKSYAKELARRGLNIVLISRSLAKLKDTASEIETQFGVKTKCVTLDFSAVSKIHDTASEALEGLDIGVLVNNVGAGPKYTKHYSKRTDVDFIRYNTDINIHSVTMMTHVVLPKLIAKGKGAILNIASGSAYAPSPMAAIYSSSKAFVDFFSQAVQAECRSQGVIVQAILPFFVSTKLTDMKPSVFVPKADVYVKSQLATVGLSERTPGYWSHALQCLGVLITPHRIREKMYTALMEWVNEAKRAQEKNN